MRALNRLIGTSAATAAALAFFAYRRDLGAAKARIESQRQTLDVPEGVIEFGEAGDGPAVLLIHGAGGGFDQGLDLGAGFLGDGYRIVAPSRFGYLGTPLPADASPEAQADAHLRLLDALQLERVPVIGVSAGGPSAMQLCLRHPERCSALVLVVPMAWAPRRGAGDARLSPLFLTVLNAVTSSDVLFWTAMKFARSTLIETILGTPLEVYRAAAPEQRRAVDAVLRTLLPMSGRAAGISNDSVVSSTLTRYPLEEIQVPVLVISAADDRYDTFESGLMTAEQVCDGSFIGFPSGGHLLLGHEEEVRAEITRFVGSVSRETVTLALTR